VARFKPHRLNINCANIHEVKIGKLLGGASVRVVYEGDWNGNKVAVKVNRNRKETNIYHIYQTTREAAVLYALRRKPNINRIVGWCNETIVLELADGIVGVNRNKISVERTLQKLLDVAKGVQQVHAVNVTHGDIKGSQFLIGHNGHLLLGDFDMMKFTGLSNTNTKCKFMLPRGMGDIPQDERLDIGRVAIVLEGILENIDVKSTEYIAMKRLIAKAMNRNIYYRPSATEIVERIEATLSNYKKSRV